MQVGSIVRWDESVGIVTVCQWFPLEIVVYFMDRKYTPTSSPGVIEYFMFNDLEDMKSSGMEVLDDL